MAQALPLPYIWPQKNLWLGLDGNWSTFPLSVGTPLQYFNVLPSISGSQTWLPVDEGCAWAPKSADCAASRGVDASSVSKGFFANSSSTWQQLGLFGLEFEEELYGKNENGLYGLDRIVLGSNASAATISGQVIAGIGSAEFWIASLGLSDVDSALGQAKNGLASLLSSLYSQRTVPSRSFGYAAGAAYREVPGSLVLGGYDEASIKSANLSFALADDRSLRVDLTGIVSTNTLRGTVSMLANTTGLTMRLDSAVTQLWLPASACDLMALAFGLIYDESANLYLVNNTMHDKLRQLSPETTFTVGPADGSINIVFPYAAFDLTIGLPVYNTTYHYFPLRKADNETQYVLGRAFFQEAYLFVDWDRSSFTLGQAVHGEAQRIVPVLPPASVAVGFHLSKGAIAGIVAGSVILVAALSTICWWRRVFGRQPRFSDEDDDAPGVPYLQQQLAELPDEKTAVELMSASLHELADGPKPVLQIMSTEVFELDATSPSQELDGSPVGLPPYKE